jgi:hypothetical protein
MMACRVEQTRQNCEHGSNEIHRQPPCALVVTGLRSGGPGISF